MGGTEEINKFNEDSQRSKSSWKSTNFKHSHSNFKNKSIKPYKTTILRTVIWIASPSEMDTGSG